MYEKKLVKLMVGMSEDFENCNETEDFETEAYSDSDDGGELEIQGVVTLLLQFFFIYYRFYLDCQDDLDL